MNQNKIDEGSVTLSDLNIQLTIKQVMKRFDFDISDEEIQYYMDNHKPSNIQIQLVFAFYTQYFGSYRDLNLLTFRQYIILLLILKKKLLLELGFGEDENGERKIYHASLPYILTGNLQDRVNTRVIRNNKFIAKLNDSYLYNDLKENRYSYLEYLKQDLLLSLLSSVINTRFTYVAYEQQDKLGEEIVYSDDKVSDELLFFFESCV